MSSSRRNFFRDLAAAAARAIPDMDEKLEVACPEGEALENVPRSAAEAGHAVSVEGTTVRIVRA